MSSALRAFVACAGFHARQLLRTPFFVQTAVVTPVGFLVLRVMGAAGSGAAVPSTVWFDAAVAGMWATTTTAVGIIGFQRFQGTLEHLAMSVRAPGVVFGSVCAAAVLIGLAGLPLALSGAAVLGTKPHVTAETTIGFVSALLACMASAVALAAGFILSRRALVYEPLILAPVWLLCGLVIPVDTFPQWLQWLAHLHPLTSAVDAARADTVAVAAAWSGLAFVLCLIYLGLAGVGLRAALKRARVDGTLALA